MDRDKSNAALLAQMYSNTKMAVENINNVMSKVKGKSMITELTAQIENYSGLAARTSDLMHQRSIPPRQPGLMEKAMAKFGIGVNTLIDSTDSHIADMVAKGTHMGADSLSQAYAKYGLRCDRQVADLCGEIIDYERKVSADIEKFHR